MEVLAPLHIKTEHQVLLIGGVEHLIATASLGIDLESGKALLSPEFIEHAMCELDGYSIPDPGMPKPKGEFLVSGAFYSPTGTGVEAGSVNVRIGGKEKTIYVFGNRCWEGPVPSRPEYFNQCDISYSNAFGGAQFQANPIGRGYKEEQLPALEYPEWLIGSPGDTPPPCSLGPRDSTWSERSQYKGTYDKHYLSRHYPGHPDDLDLNFFMTSAPDQWIDGYFSGDETIFIENMHPQVPRIETQLPGLHVRSFYRMATGEELSELPLNLDTVWIFPAKKMAVLYWRGGIELQVQNGMEDANFVYGFEAKESELKDISHYQRAIDFMGGNEADALKAFSSTRLVPKKYRSALMQMYLDSQSQEVSSPFLDNLSAKVDTVRTSIDQELSKMNSTLESELLHQRDAIADPTMNDRLAEMEALLSSATKSSDERGQAEIADQLEAILPGVTGKGKELDLDDLDFTVLDQLHSVVDKEVSTQQDRLNNEIDTAMKTLDSSLRSDELFTSEHSSLMQEQVNPMLELLSASKEQESAPLPRMPVSTIVDSMTSLQESSVAGIAQPEAGKEGGELVPELPDSISSMLDDISLGTAALESQSREFQAIYREVAHMQPIGKSPHAESLDIIKQRFERKLANSESVAGMDLACLDFTGMNLSGVDFSDCLMEQVILSGANLTGARLNRANLARARLDNAVLIDIEAREANLGSVVAVDCDLSGADLQSAILSKGDFSRALFKSARLTDAQILDWSVDGADFSSSEMESMAFINLKVSATRFVGANLSGATFIECSIQGCDFSSATLDRSIWASSNIKNSDFIASSMVSASFVSSGKEAPDIDKVNFSQAQLPEANFQSISFFDVSFEEAKLERANFLDARLSGCRFQSSRAICAVFRDADLSRVNFSSADCMQALFSGADLTGANLSQCNCYGSDFLNAKFGETRFNGGNFDRSLLQNWQPS